MVKIGVSVFGNQQNSGCPYSLRSLTGRELGDIKDWLLPDFVAHPVQKSGTAIQATEKTIVNRKSPTTN